MKPRNFALLGLALACAGCHTDMWRQPRTDTYEESDFFVDGQSARPLVAGTVPRGQERADDAFYTGARNGKWVTEIPMKVDEAVIRRGQERYNVFCSPCHGMVGDGKGMITERGFALRRMPASYHTDRLRQMPVGHFYDVMTNGYGSMYSYASRVEPKDRWAIAAYIRALQLSQNAKPADADPQALADANAAPGGGTN